jgi:hypothetical protein
VARSQETLGSYRTRVLREVRDAQQQYFNNQGSATPFKDIDAWINEAIAWRDIFSGGSREYKQDVPLTAAVDQYDLTDLFPDETVLDVVTVWLLWGNMRVQLDERPFSEVTNRWRPWVSYVNVPGAYCRYGATGIFVATAPGPGYSIDLDVVTRSCFLVDEADADPLPYPYTEPVVKYAASLAKEDQRQTDEAERKYQQALRALRDINDSRVGELPQQYVTARGTRQ